MNKPAKRDAQTQRGYYDDTRTWRDYQRGIDYHNRRNIFDNVNRAFRFYNGDQWSGVQAGGESLPVLNIIAPTVRYKVSVVVQNALEIVYRPIRAAGENFAAYTSTCEVLNALASSTWERLKLDRRMRDDVREAAITGDKYRYFYVSEGAAAPGEEETEEGRTPVYPASHPADVVIETEEIDKTNIFFGDEQCQDIQAQPYIIIAQRRTVRTVREEARAYGATEDMIEAIVSDTDSTYQAGDAAREEVDTDDSDFGKCISLVRFEKRDSAIWVSRSAKQIEYQQPTKIDGLTLYPIAGMVWSHEKGSARGAGEVLRIIPNQIEINKTLYRITQAVKQAALPRLVYTDALQNPADLDTVGAPLHIDGADVREINKIIDYLQPTQLTGDASNLLRTYIDMTRELAGAGDVATGTVDPTKASGTAIIAVKQSSELPISDSVSAYRQYMEDIALIWYDLWTAYAVNGLHVWLDAENDAGPGDIDIPASELSEMRIAVRIETSPTNPYDRFAQEQSLENLLAGKYITFPEYVDALPDDAVMPKARIKAILDAREASKAKQAQQAAMQQPTPAAQLPDAAQQAETAPMPAEMPAESAPDMAQMLPQISSGV